MYMYMGQGSPPIRRRMATNGDEWRRMGPILGVLHGNDEWRRMATNGDEWGFCLFTRTRPTSFPPALHIPCFSDTMLLYITPLSCHSLNVGLYFTFFCRKQNECYLFATLHIRLPSFVFACLAPRWHGKVTGCVHGRLLAPKSPKGKKNLKKICTQVKFQKQKYCWIPLFM